MERWQKKDILYFQRINKKSPCKQLFPGTFLPHIDENTLGKKPPEKGKSADFLSKSADLFGAAGGIRIIKGL